MKYTFIGDLHCRDIWKKIVELESDSDKIIFLGDYLTPKVSLEDPTDVCGFLYEVLDYKDKYPNQVILLRGNHDLDNLGYYWAECSPCDYYSQEYMSREDVKQWFLKNTQWAYVLPLTNIVCSHAGISKEFLYACAKLLAISEWDKPTWMIEQINKLEPSELFGFTPCKLSDYDGSSATQPCTWIRPSALFYHGVEGITQIVGHTPVRESIFKLSNEDINIWLCDALRLNQYLVLEDDEFIIKNIK